MESFTQVTDSYKDEDREIKGVSNELQNVYCNKS